MIFAFIAEFKKLYGIEYMSSNMHNLAHIIDEVEKFGILPSLTSYSFENCLYTIKKLLRTASNPLVQVASRTMKSTCAQRSIDPDGKDRNFKVEVQQTDRMCQIAFPDFLLSSSYQTSGS